MSYLHVVVPHSSESCCAKRRFSPEYPQQLGAHIMPHEYDQSINAVNAAYSKVHAGPAISHFGSWLLYATGLTMVIAPNLFVQDYNYESFDSFDFMWIGWGLVITSIIGMVASSRWMRNRRINDLNTALAHANMAYNQRGVAWRVVNPGLRNMTIEITGLAPVQAPMPQPINLGQVQPMMQHQSMNYAVPMQVNQSNPQNHYQPYFAHPAQQLGSPSHQQQQVQSTNQPQYIHTAPGYPAVYPAEHANAPLMAHQQQY